MRRGYQGVFLSHQHYKQIPIDVLFRIEFRLYVTKHLFAAEVFFGTETSEGQRCQDSKNFVLRTCVIRTSSEKVKVTSSKYAILSSRF